MQKITTIEKGIEKSLEDIQKPENDIGLDFKTLFRVLSKFENNRILSISQELYNKISDDLLNIFSYNDLYIYNIEPLKKLFLTKPSGGHVQIAEKKVSDKTSVAELIYTILAMRSQIKTIKQFLGDVLNAEDSQSRSLDIWSKQITKVQKASEDSENISDNKPNKYLNRAYVYESNKSMINIKEISRYKELINPELREVSIGNTAIFTSPEHKINSILVNNTNVIFLISATGGIYGDLSTSYDFNYLKDKLRYEGRSSFKEMSNDEISLCKEIRNKREANRKITVNFFNQDISSFPNNKTQKVVERFKKLIWVWENFLNDLKNEVPWFGSYKKQELKNFIHFLFYLFENDSIQETIAFTQTLRWIKKLIYYWEKNKHENFKLHQSSEHPNIYHVQIDHALYKSNLSIKLILYEADFDKNYINKTTKKTYLDELVEKEGEKIFFISAYQSASKGLNPIIKNQNGEEKDFDSLVLLMDSYYTVMKSKNKSGDSEKSTTLYHFALMKSLVKFGDSSREIKDFNKYLSEPEALDFREKQHQILLGKAILQAIGRSERRDFPNQTIKIFINHETRKNLVNFYRYLEAKEPREIGKFSVNNYQVYLEVKAEEKKRSINNYDEHVCNEIDAALAFEKFRTTMLNEFDLFHQNKHTFDITKTWNSLRDPIALKDPPKYQENLKKTQLFPDDFVESLFYYNPQQSEFTPYLTSIDEEGQKFQLISDSINGEKNYSYQKRLYPEYLQTNARDYDLEGDEIVSLNDSTNSIYKLYNEFIPQPEIFNTYIPRPHFFYDVLYPSLTENFVEHWIENVIFQGKNWKAVKDTYGFEQLLDFKKYNKLYEKFDLYYLKDNSLFCIDVKAWSMASGNRLSEKTLKKTQNKLNTIVSDYPEFINVRGLLLNLHASKEKNHQYSSNLFSGNLIYSDVNNCPVESKILREFLFLKRK